MFGGSEKGEGVYQTPRDRDACASIRGYVYQIDRTVDRWLSLTAVQTLELERGEDIDLVGRLVLDDGTFAESRLLEQVKHRQTTITLRTPAALEALANFHDHRRYNPGADIRFCFMTNAAVGLERLARFPGRVSGIALWEEVRTGQIDDSEAPAAIEHLRQFLANSPRPEGFSDTVWKGWQEFMATANPEAFREYVERFEWSTQQPAAQQFPQSLRSRILTLGFAGDELEAEAVADRTFVHVARLLSTPGLKRLTVGDRTQLLAAPALTQGDRTLLVRLRAVVAAHTDRLDQLEADFTALGGRVEAMFVAGAAERVEFAVPAPDLSSPQPVARLSPRRQTVGTLCQVMERSGWLALHGSPDVGKSQLAVQIAACGGCRGWVRFHHAQPTAEAIRHLDSALATLAGWGHPPQRGGWYAEALAAGGGGGLVVLDDLPRAPGDDPFAEGLLRIGQAARAAGTHIVSTSQYELPSRLRHHLGGWLDDRPSPLFTDGEAAELFGAHGAPEDFLTGRRVRPLNGLAAGHPLLLAATAEFLAAREWEYNEDEIDTLLRGGHAQAILSEVVERLTRTLGTAPRELLYRLALPIGPFDQAVVSALAGVSPPVDRPRERLSELIGGWVQRDTDTTLSVSPLVQPLGRSELGADVRVRCYRALADLVTNGKVVNQFAAECAIVYNLGAGQPGRAVTLYAIILVKALRVKRADHIVSVIDKWRNTPLPDGLGVGESLFIRAYQLAAFTKYRLDTRFVVRHIDRLLERATDHDGWGVVALAVQNLRRFGSRDPARMIRYLRRAIALPAV